MSGNEEPPLSDDERKRLRKILNQDEKVAWLWSLIRKIAAWILGAAAALVAFRDDVSMISAMIADWFFHRGD